MDAPAINRPASWAYYNEFDAGAAAWLRELIKEGHIADGEVDTRSIIDVRPADLAGFTQCHMFAGIGGWSYALRLAGWGDDRPVWTGSPPCQPFSAAGRQEGRDDARHLAPHFISLVGAARPTVLFGEQVASAEVFGKAAGGAGKRAGGPPSWAWIDDLSDRLEAAHYAVGTSDFPSAGIGAPHIRQRTFFGAVRLADAEREGVRGQPGGQHSAQAGAGNWEHLHDPVADGDADTAPAARPLHGFWADADWLFCRDGKWRPVEARAQPLVDGLPAGMGRVRDPCAKETEGAIEIYAEITQTRPEEVLRDLCCALAAEAAREREVGGLAGLLPPSLLLAFVCQLAAQGWRLAECLPLSRPQKPSGGMRLLWNHEAAAGASRQRGLVGQQPGELADLMHILSPLLARDAQAAWGDAILADAEIGFPLGTGSPARVARLRGYGNAINPHAAALFIAAFDVALNS